MFLRKFGGNYKLLRNILKRGESEIGGEMHHWLGGMDAPEQLSCGLSTDQVFSNETYIYTSQNMVIIILS